jgi:hypothetical protein
MAGLFKIVLTSLVSGNLANPFINVFGYRSNLAVVNEEQALGDAFDAQMIPEVRKIVKDTMTFVRIEVYNVTNGLGYYDKHPIPALAGLRTGDAQPNFNAWAFQYNRVNVGQRNGAKRFGLMSETDTTGPNPTAGMTVILDALAVKLGAALKVGVIDTWFPEILERKPSGVYPWTSHPILGVQFKRITSQNSRKT